MDARYVKIVFCIIAGVVIGACLTIRQKPKSVGTAVFLFLFSAITISGAMYAFGMHGEQTLHFLSQ